MAKIFKENIFTSERLRKGKSAIPSLLELLAMDVPHWEDDFMGDQMRYDGTAPGTYQSTANGTAAATAAIATGSLNGVIALDPGTDDDGRSDLSLGRHFRGENNAHIWWRILTPSAITSWKTELGLTDVVSGTDAGAVNVKATPTFNATDAVVLCRDTDNNTNLSLMGVKAGTADTVIDFSTALATSTYYYIGIELRGDEAKGYLLDADGKLLETTAWMDDAVTATTLLTPWAFNQNRSASQRTMYIDFLLAYQWRTNA